MSKVVLYLNFALLAVFLFYFLRYLWSLFKEGFARPEEWAHAIRHGFVEKGLNRARRRYKDKLRFYAFWLQVERIKKLRVPGAFAELGVYRGQTAHILHLLDPDRELHLFDTFAGFPASDLGGEKGEAATYTINDFADTSLEKVKALFGESAKVHFHPGYFPQTAEGLEVMQFALVSLDADLYMPTRAGLEFFYPRLSPGGVIFIHDYNYRWEGIRKAVDEFAESNKLAITLLPDRDGTVILTKSRV